ncbi:unnamed protein product [Acanthoscelides obtectus]|uniref:Uncharacterized protein n=1 Tax=Acanthoscelides obtectus TaxID=200917 RepID=A0A9P0KBA6_ACAOB|nr:unnamed protein product [Acanthoscelides obtectus]CAK1645716.1 hypothetical protein AOBTE_LOCUS14224 [Acanthoscelides obtectus]
MAGQGQRIIIPKGSIRTGQTNVIEIPVHLQNSSVVVAQPKDAPSETPAMEGGGRCVPSCVNYNVPRSRAPIAPEFDTSLLNDPATPPVPPPRTRRPPQQSRSPVRRFDLSESVQSGMSCGSPNQTPSTPYAKFAVEAAERNKQMAASTPMDRSFLDSGENWASSPIAQACYDSPVLYRPHPRAYRPPGTIELNWPDGTQTRRRFEGVSTPRDAKWPRGPTTAAEEKMQLLDQMEFVEQDQLMDDLRNYQKTRRRLVYDLVNMSSLIETPTD